jgi:hypothetical protein
MQCEKGVEGRGECRAGLKYCEALKLPDPCEEEESDG